MPARKLSYALLPYLLALEVAEAGGAAEDWVVVFGECYLRCVPFAYASCYYQRAHIGEPRRLRHCAKRSSGSVRSQQCRSWADYIPNTFGYDFREGGVVEFKV